MKRTSIIALAFIAALLITACAPSKLDEKTSLDNKTSLDDKKSTIVGKILTVNDVPYTSVNSTGDTIEIFYETSDATGYDAQIISDWGMIFATSANFDYKEITIINTINYMPAAKMTATSDNVKLLGNGWINESEFWDTVKIESVE